MQSFWFCKPTILLSLCIRTQTKNNLFASSKPCGSRCSCTDCYIHVYRNIKIILLENLLSQWTSDIDNNLILVISSQAPIFEIHMIKDVVNINVILVHVRSWAWKEYEIKVSLTFNGIQFYRLASRVCCLSNAFTFHLFSFPFLFISAT